MLDDRWWEDYVVLALCVVGLCGLATAFGGPAEYIASWVGPIVFLGLVAAVALCLLWHGVRLIKRAIWEDDVEAKDALFWGWIYLWAIPLLLSIAIATSRWVQD